MYQMGESALVDAGYYKPKKNGNYNNKWDGEFTGLDDVYSVDDFLNNIRAQENAIRIYHKKLWNYIKDVAENYDGKISPKDRNSTPSGKSNNSNGSSSDGKWVTINGNHVLIEK